MALDKTTQERIKADADKRYPRVTAIAMANRTGYIAGATAENNRAQRMADALEEIAKEANNSPEDTWGEIAVRMKRIAITQLQQFKDGKGKEVENEG